MSPTKRDPLSSHQAKLMARHLVCLVAAKAPLVSQLRKPNLPNGTRKKIKIMLSMEVSFKSVTNISEEQKVIDFRSNKGKLKRLKVEN